MTDLAVRLLRDGYRAVARDRVDRQGATTYVSRLLGRRAVVLGGAAGARVFYDEAVVERAGAVPPPLAWLLFGRGAVHGLDDDAHRARKSWFVGRLGADAVGDCATLARRRLRDAVPRWSGREVDLHDELVVAYGGAVLHWVGARLSDSRAESLSRAYVRIVDGFGFGSATAYARAWAARRSTDAWAQGLLDDVRAGRASVPDDSVVAGLAASDLDLRTAAVELGNVVRPTIAVSWLGVHAASALAALGPADRAALTAPEAIAERWSFAQEVRRITPFVPALAGRVRHAATHADVDLRVGDHVVLDVRGIDLDPDRWAEPDAFAPDRFVEGRRQPNLYDLVPQGGGPALGHRCPGESMTMQLLAHTVDVLAGCAITFGAEPRTYLGRMPTLPEGSRRVRVEAG